MRVLIRVSFSYQQVYDDLSGGFFVNRICLLRKQESLELEEQWIITSMVRPRGFGIEYKNTTIGQRWNNIGQLVVKTVEVVRLVL